MNRGLKFRIFPTKKQEELLQKSFGCNRLVYNLLLAENQKRYKKGEKRLNEFGGNNYINQILKIDENYKFLKEVDSYCLTSASEALNKAYINFFNKISDFPKFKNKHKAKKSYTTYSIRFKLINRELVQIPKIGKTECIITQNLPKEFKIKSATISQDAKGYYYCSVCMEYENQISPIQFDNKSSSILGLDYKSDGLYTDSNGVVANPPKYFRESEKKLAKLQKRISKKKGSKKGETKSNNWLKLNEKILKLQSHIANQRKDYLQKLSTELANTYDMIAVEDINLRNIAQSLHLGKSTNDNGFGMFRNMLEYKLNDRGKYFIKVGKFYPSSQVCHSCGCKHKLKLNERIYICPDCGAEIDRDWNAAMNIRDEGLRILNEKLNL